MKPTTDVLKRINRAKKHLDVLNREIKAFLALEPYRCTIKIDSQDGRNIFYPYLTKPLPSTWGLLVGEFAHGLRSALDNIAWSIAIERNKRTVFPIFTENCPQFVNRLKLLREDARMDIQAVQPFNKPKGEKKAHQLWILHRIDNIDKHRVIVPGVTRIYVATGLPRPAWMFIDGFSHLNKGDVELKLINPNLAKDFKPNIRGQIGFDISSEPDDIHRISPRVLFSIHNFVRNDVYPRFAKFL